VVLMLENSIYSVISPENCANIIFKDPAKAQEVAPAMRLTAEDLLQLGLIDGIVAEPPGGAHEDMDAAAVNLKAELVKRLDSLAEMSADQLVADRYQKFRRMGNFFA
jgi:acetyl-CoA carboxylase carboxyl transferase subunit alpha